MKRRNDGVDVQGKAPGFWYYPSDFERDVQILSLASQGLWMRMLGWMHYCDNRGYLELPTGIPMNAEDISAKVGKSKKDVQRCITEMERIGLFSRDERGCIFNRRMVQDTAISRVRKEAAAARLVDAPRDDHGRFAGSFDPPKSPQITVPSSSSSSSYSPKGKEPPFPPIDPVSEFDFQEGFRQLWDRYPSKGRTKIIDTQRVYVETITPDPERLHGALLDPILPGGKWEKSENWSKGYVCSLFEYIRNRRDLEDPEPYKQGREPTKTNARLALIEQSRKTLQEADLSDVETSY